MLMETIPMGRYFPPFNKPHNPIANNRYIKFSVYIMPVVVINMLSDDTIPVTTKAFSLPNKSFVVKYTTIKAINDRIVTAIFDTIYSDPKII